MPQQLILVRGLPGSGKSTLAKKLAKEKGAVHVEADMHFEDQQGNYSYDASKIEQAHQWCQQTTREALIAGADVIVSNTFVCLWEMQVYIEMAKEFNVELIIKTCTGEYENIHQVPQETIQNMKDKWEEF